MQRGFIKNKEDFICEQCSTHIQGTGYTNHCHQCFYSKHVDIQPGDRAHSCKGSMRPTSVSGSTRSLVIEHTCVVCGFTRNNKVQDEDNISKLAELMESLNSKRNS